MGRRSINTTKSGKYMNPTDQARKEARKKELKKNKKQRQMVRAAVLKGKDPIQIISEMEKIDAMEYNVLQPPPLNEKVLKDKRKKLKETLDRVLSLYDKDDPEKWAELKRLEVEYEKRRFALLTFAESVRHAQQVQVDDIPLPSLQLPSDPTSIFMGIPSQIPLPAEIPLAMVGTPAFPHPHPILSSLQGVILPPGIVLPPPPSILKKTSAYIPTPEKAKNPPGVPPGPPPDLSSDEEDEPMETEPSLVDEKAPSTLPPRQRVIRFADDEEDSHDSNVGDSAGLDNKQEEPIPETTAPKPTTLQQKMLAMAGQDIDQFMKEMEEVHRKREIDRTADLNARLSLLEGDSNSSSSEKQSASQNVTTAPVNKSVEDDRQPLQPPGTQPNMSLPPPSTQPQGMPPLSSVPPLLPPGLLFCPPPLRVGVPPLGIRLPPGPPPGRPTLPPGPPPGLPPRLGLRLPPGPPPGMPPRLLRPPGPPPRIPLMTLPTSLSSIPIPPLSAATPNVLSAAPQLINRSSIVAEPKKQQGATIEAKPQIRNLSADITRFLPTALRVKRDDKKKVSSRGSSVPEPRQESVLPKPPVVAGQPTKDDAYMQFMREMEGLL